MEAMISVIDGSNEFGAARSLRPKSREWEAVVPANGVDADESGYGVSESACM